MKNKIIRTTAVLSLIGGITLSTWSSMAGMGLALPMDKILKTLQPVPVFTLVDDQGVPLVAIDQKNKDKKVTGIFISESDANKFYEQLQKTNPDIAKKVKIRLVSLGDIYKVAQEYEGKPDGLTFSYVPTVGEVEEAKKIITANGQKYSGGVPLFVARGGKDQGYLTIQENNQVVIPFFFDIAQLQVMLERFKKEKPDLASSVKVEVVLLETIMQTMKESNDDNLSKIVLVPTRESLKAVQSSQGNTTNNNNSVPAKSNSPANSLK